jgi:protein SCO1
MTRLDVSVNVHESGKRVAARWALALALTLACLFIASAARADDPKVSSDVPPPAASAGLPTEQLAGIGFDQHINERLPLDTTFIDEAGNPVALGNYFGKRPVVLALTYAECPMLCNLVLSGLTGSMRAVSSDVGAGYDVLAVSFDPKDTPETSTKRKAQYVRRYGRPGAAAGFHFLTGTPESITALTKAVGFRYELDTQTGQYAHPAGVVVIMPDGRIARYLYGSEFSPRDMELAIAEAAVGKASLTNQLLLLCYRYDPQTGSYSARAIGAVRIGGVLTLVGLGLFMVQSARRNRRSRPAPARGSDSAPVPDSGSDSVNVNVNVNVPVPVPDSGPPAPTSGPSTSTSTLTSTPTPSPSEGKGTR